RAGLDADPAAVIPDEDSPADPAPYDCPFSRPPPAEASRLQSGPKATLWTFPVCPLRVRASWPVAASHTCTTPSTRARPEDMTLPGLLQGLCRPEDGVVVRREHAAWEPLDPADEVSGEREERVFIQGQQDRPLPLAWATAHFAPPTLPACWA